jgi:hypothetical protein
MSLLVEESKNNKMNLLEVEKFEVNILFRILLALNQEEKNQSLINFATKL